MKQYLILSSALVSAILAPLLYWIGTSSGDAYSFKGLMQINGACLGLLLVASSGVALRKYGRSEESITVVCLFTVLAAFWLAVVNASSGTPCFDYRCIQNGAVNLLQGKSPYGVDTGYFLYPPLYAQAMAASYSFIVFIGRQFHWHPQGPEVFRIIFYLFQNLQVLALAALAALSYRFTVLTGRINRTQAALLTFAVLALNNPLSGTVFWNQVNVYITCLIIFSLIAAQPLNGLRGLALALGIHLKAYPVLLLPALILSKQWRPVAWTVLWTAVLAVISTVAGGTHIWATYLHAAASFIADITSKPPIYMVDGSNLFSLVYESCKLLQPKSPPDTEIVNHVVTFLKVALSLWFGWRILKRQRPVSEHGQETSQIDRLYDNACDLLSLGLLAGPTTLNHHYVIAIPIILWTIVKAGFSRPFAVIWGTILILCFQSHVLSLMCLSPVGLVLLAYARREQGRLSSDAKPAAVAQTVEWESGELVSTSRQ
jgi:hypothetical protein